MQIEYRLIRMSFFFDLTIYIYVYDLVILRYKTNEKTIFWEFVFFYVFIKCKIPLLDSPNICIWFGEIDAKKKIAKNICVYLVLISLCFWPWLCFSVWWLYEDSLVYSNTHVYIYMHNFVKPMQTTTKYVYLEDTCLTVQSDRWSMVYMHAVCVCFVQVVF